VTSSSIRFFNASRFASCSSSSSSSCFALDSVDAIAPVKGQRSAAGFESGSGEVEREIDALSMKEEEDEEEE
jgi:hypothetical protein